MDLVEFQGKQFFARHGVPVPPPGDAVRTVDEAVAAASRILEGGTSAVVVKAQVKVGGRGKAGGVKVVTSVEDARAAAESILGLDIKGHIVNVLYIEPASDIVEEDAQAVGLSVHSGAHLTLFPRVVELLQAAGADDVLVFGGGIIPPADIEMLRSQGVAAVFTPGAPMAGIVDWVRANVPSRT